MPIAHVPTDYLQDAFVHMEEMSPYLRGQVGIVLAGRISPETRSRANQATLSKARKEEKPMMICKRCKKHLTWGDLEYTSGGRQNIDGYCAECRRGRQAVAARTNALSKVQPQGRPIPTRTQQQMPVRQTAARVVAPDLAEQVMQALEWYANQQNGEKARAVLIRLYAEKG